MRKSLLAPLVFACLPLVAQEAELQNKFQGTWEAKVGDTVVCTIRLKTGQTVSGETIACSIHVDENGNLQVPESTDQSDKPAPILNAKLKGDTLNFEERDGNDITVFQLKLVGDGKAELSFLNAPVPIKPIRFTRK